MAQQPKLILVLLGCTPPGRHIEQHDIFLGIGDSIESLFAGIKAYWPEGKVHIDAWREVTYVEGHRISIVAKNAEANTESSTDKLFLMNLGGYLEGKFEEQHYIVLTVKPDKAAATKEAKATAFYQHNHFANAVSHIDDRYGVDVDDIYEIEELLSPALKEKYHIEITPATGLPEDEYHLGYVKLPAELHSPRPLKGEG
jgi:LysM repeat protein